MEAVPDDKHHRLLSPELGSQTYSPLDLPLYHDLQRHSEPASAWKCFKPFRTGNKRLVQTLHQGLTDVARAALCIAIAVMYDLMFCVPFGESFFPADWDDMPVPRTLGIQMFLLTTALCQFVLVLYSDFDGAVGYMMIENVPYMLKMCNSIIHELGSQNPAVLPTILVTYALSSVVSGAIFYALGHWKLGNCVYLIPKQVTMGATGGISAFIVQTGVEISTGRSFSWSLGGLKGLVKGDVVWLWVSAGILAVTLLVLRRFTTSPLLLPLYFVAIAPLFYMVLLVVGVSQDDARDHGWFFDRTTHVSFYLLWEQYEFSIVAWRVIPKQFGTILGLTFFSLLHIPINIPGVSFVTGKEVDINNELITHGISNTLGGLCGSVHNYLSYTGSTLYYKCGGSGRRSGFVIGVVILFFFVVGPNAISYVPRCMAGCVMFYVGWGLIKESLFDTYNQLDILEFGNVWVIALTMTFWGINEGLAVGALMACVVFVVQSVRAPTNAPVCGSKTGATMRSQVNRTTGELAILDQSRHGIHIVQLRGHIFFANSSKVSDYVQELLMKERQRGSCIGGESRQPLRWLVLDFTSVVGLDSTAAERLVKLKNMSDATDCKLVFAAVPHAYKQLVEKLVEFSCRDTIRFAISLDKALEWCENDVLREIGGVEPDYLRTRTDECTTEILKNFLLDQPQHVQEQWTSYFHAQEVKKDEFLWKAGDESERIVVPIDGSLVILQDDTTEEVAVGSLVGEVCFLTGEKRNTALIATRKGNIYVLDRASYTEMFERDWHLVFLLQHIVLQSVSSELQNVRNRV